jgi:UDP-3-O-acyl-N-acetylglucosamine deacetylase
LHPANKHLDDYIAFVQRPSGLHYKYHAEYPHKSIGSQTYDWDAFDQNIFDKKISTARAVRMVPELLQPLMILQKPLSRWHGLRDDNALMVGRKAEPGFLNQGPLGREEFVLHKILDMLGSWALTGIDLQDTEIIYSKTGHRTEIEMLRKLSPDAFISVN